MPNTNIITISQKIDNKKEIEKSKADEIFNTIIKSYIFVTKIKRSILRCNTEKSSHMSNQLFFKINRKGLCPQYALMF